MSRIRKPKLSPRSVFCVTTVQAALLLQGEKAELTGLRSLVTFSAASTFFFYKLQQVLRAAGEQSSSVYMSPETYKVQVWGEDGGRGCGGLLVIVTNRRLVKTS